jgi:hypothetical protein
MRFFIFALPLFLAGCITPYTQRTMDQADSMAALECAQLYAKPGESVPEENLADFGFCKSKLAITYYNQMAPVYQPTYQAYQPAPIEFHPIQLNRTQTNTNCQVIGNQMNCTTY